MLWSQRDLSDRIVRLAEQIVVHHSELRDRELALTEARAFYSKVIEQGYIVLEEER